MKLKLTLLCALFLSVMQTFADERKDFETFKKNFEKHEELVPARTQKALRAAANSYSDEVFNLKTGEPVKALKPNNYKLHSEFWMHIYNLATLYGYSTTYPESASTFSQYSGSKDIYNLIIRSVNWYFDNEQQITKQQYHKTYSYHDEPLMGVMNYVVALTYNKLSKAKTGSDERRAFDSIISFCNYQLDQGDQVRGANWSFRVMKHCFRHVYLSNDPALLTRLRVAIEKALHPTLIENVDGRASDGFYPDGMMFHHGEMCFFTMYSMEFVVKHLEMNNLIYGTQWAFTPEEWTTLAFLYWEGLRYAIYRGNADYSTAPKRASELPTRIENTVANAYQIPEAVLKYAPGLTGYDEQFKEYLKNYDKTPEFKASDAKLVELDEHKYFWTGDYQVHQRNNYHIAVRRSSLRARAPEDAGTNTGKMHLHYGSGYTPILVRGDEYRVARIGWDWLTLPGTTNETVGTIASGKAGSRKRNNTDFSGGLGEGKYGVGGFIYNIGEPNKDDTQWNRINGAYAHKSNFFFDKGMLCLGSSIKRTAVVGGKKANIITTLDQKRSETDMVYCVDGGAQSTMKQSNTASESFTVNSRAWFYHSGVGYIIIAPEGKSVKVDAVIEARDLNPILKAEKEGFNKVYGAGLTAEERANNNIWMWQLSIDHGTDPEDDQYIYMVLPNVTAKQTEAYCAVSEFTVECLTNDMHVVSHQGLKMYQGVFFKEGTATLATGGELKVEKPIILQLRNEGDKSIVTAQNPRVYSPKHPLVSKVLVPGDSVGVLYDAPVGVECKGMKYIDDTTIGFTFSHERNYEGQAVTLEL